MKPMVMAMKGMLKERKLPIQEDILIKFLKEIDKVAPWFSTSGSLDLISWGRLGADLKQSKEEGKLGPGTWPLYKMISACLTDERCRDHIKQGQQALAEHQDSLSEAEREKGKEKRIKSREKEKGRRTQPKETSASGKSEQKQKQVEKIEEKSETQSPGDEKIYPSLDSLKARVHPSLHHLIKKDALSTSEEDSDSEGESSSSGNSTGFDSDIPDEEKEEIIRAVQEEEVAQKERKREMRRRAEGLQRPPPHNPYRNSVGLITQPTAPPLGGFEEMRALWQRSRSPRLLQHLP